MKIIDNREDTNEALTQGDFLYITDGDFPNTKNFVQVVQVDGKYTLVGLQDGHYWFDGQKSIIDLFSMIVDNGYTIEVVPNDKVTITIND